MRIRAKCPSANLGSLRHRGGSLGGRKSEKGEAVEEHRERELRLTSFYGCCLLISCSWGFHFIEANSTLQKNSRCVGDEGGGGGKEVVATQKAMLGIEATEVC